MPATLIQTSYNGGELSQRMEGRVDHAVYPIAVAEMLNFAPTVEGPAMKCPGFRFIRPAMASTAWLSTFIFSRTQAYVIEQGNLAWRFFTNGGMVETSPGSGVPYEVVVPYTAAEAPVISQQQSHDRLYLAHRAHPPAALTRTGATTFSYAALNLLNGPFGDQNIDEAKTVTVTGDPEVDGTATVVATAAIFAPHHIGTQFRVEAFDFSDVKAWEPGQKDWDLNDTIRSDGKVYRAVGGNSRNGSVQPTHTRGIEWDGANKENADGDKFGIQFEYVHDRFGIGQITAVNGAGTQATIIVKRRIPIGLDDTPSHRWALSAFNSVNGWPKIVLLAFGRLVFFTDFTMYASAVADYGGGRVNMATFNDGGAFTADMAFQRRLDISNPILWARLDRDGILIGTSDGEYVVRKINEAQSFASDNVDCVQQSRYGSAAVEPVQTGASTIFVQKSGRKLREANYSFQADRYIAPNIALLQRHILRSGARQLAFQQEPEEMLWAVRSDGVLSLHPHVPEQEVKGFARRVHGGGGIKSSVSIPSEDGSLDELWILLDAGGGQLNIEQQTPFWEEGETQLEDAFFVDSGITIENPASTTITGLTWLANKEVAILADGGVLPRQTVNGLGTLVLALPAPPLKVTIGRPYTARLTWLRPEARGRDGETLQSKRQKLVSIVLRLLDTLGVKVMPSNSDAENVVDRGGSSTMDQPIPLFSGDTERRTLSGGWGNAAQGTIISEDPLPCLVVSHMPQIEVAP